MGDRFAGRQLTVRLVCLCALGLGLLASAANAAPISAAFNMTGAGGAVSSNENPSGEPTNTDGLVLPGQTGPWLDLRVGSGIPTTSRVISDERVFDLGQGIELILNPGGLGEYGTFRDRNPSDELRSHVVFAEGPGSTIEWALRGLTGPAYDIILFGQQSSGGAVNPADFSILGHDSGNGIAAPVSLDFENDGNFLSVAPQNSMIAGTVSVRSGQTFAGWSGLQVQAVAPIPLPSSVLFLAGGLAMLAASRVRRRPKTGRPKVTGHVQIVSFPSHALRSVSGRPISSPT